MTNSVGAGESAADGGSNSYLVRTELTGLKSDEQIRDSMATLYGARDFVLRSEAPSFQWSVGFLKLRTLDVSSSTLSAEFAATFPAMDVARIVFFRTGNSRLTIGSRAFETRPNDGFLLPSASEFRREFLGDCSQLLLRIDADRLRSKLAALIGRPVNPKLDFHVGFAPPTPAQLRLKRMAELLMNEAGQLADVSNDLVLAEFEEMLAIAFLAANRNVYSHLFDGRRRDPAPWQVRLAEEFIAANWDKPLSIEAIAGETGIGVRSLFLTFKKARGYTPMNFLQQTRLHHARNMLQNPDAVTSVTAVSIKCGFASAGHFARYYRQAYSELPSNTLARAKGERLRNERSGEQAADAPAQGQPDSAV
jgi:AraC-like DNA-binding protein